MYCKECGHILNEYGVCPLCGQTQSGQMQPAQNQSVPNQSGQNQNQAYRQDAPNQNNTYGAQYGAGTNPYNQEQSYQNNARQNDAYQNNAYQNNAYQSNAHPNNAYLNNAYQSNAHQNNAYQNNAYQNNAHQNNAYQNNAYQNNAYQNNAYRNDTYQNIPYQNNPYNAAPGQTYQANRMNQPPQAASPAKPKKKWPLIAGISGGIVLIIAAVVIVIVSKNNVRDYTTTGKTTEETTTEITTEAPTTSEPVASGGAGTKTIMMYIVGSNLESDYGAASEDISEILNADFDDESVHFLIYTGGSNSWDNSDIPEGGNTTFLVQDGALVELEQDNEQNMGDADTLADFLTYGYENYPAEQYSVILWNHGGGAFYGFGYDELTDDSLTLLELSDAFEASPFGEDNKLEWIGFDACLMATVETADALSPYANYLIASQEPEPSWGWDYDFLSEIDDLSDGAAIGTEIADTYIETTEDNFELSLFTYSDITMSVLDLSQTEAVEAAINDLFLQANASLNDATYTKYSRIRSNTKEIASEYTGEYSYDVVDLMDLTQNMKTEFLSEATALENALSDFIVYSNTNESKANGVSIYYPYNAKQYSGYYIPMYYEFGFAKDYADYITNFAALLTNSATLTAEWDPNTMIPTANGDMTFSLQLTDAQADSYQNGYYVISRADTDQPGNYIFVAMSNQVALSDSNMLTANFDGQIIYMQNATTSEQYEVMYTEQESTSDYTRYLLSSILYNDDIEGDDAMYAYFVLETTPDNPQGEIVGAYPIENLIVSEGSELFPDRYEIDINDYQNIAFGSASHQFTSTEDLTNFNEADWSDVTLWYSSFPISEGFHTTMGGMIPDVPYFGMFIIEDAQGNRHCSNLVQLQ